MIDRQQLETILRRRFPGAPFEDIAAAANAIMGLDREAPADRQRGDPGGAGESRRQLEARDLASPLPRTSP